ncbi:MAG: HD domain-containing phosphohydrolase [Terasakiella sp.]|uniref:HD domain-containing phosphohydrolase n=1 Tax=unclassified Terasakiella TaxID=2614952 RepID=UPI003AFFA5C1
MRVRFKLSLTLVSLAVICSLSIATLFSIWVLGTRTAKEVAGNLFTAVSNNVENQIVNLLDQSVANASLLASRKSDEAVFGDGLDASILPLYFSVLEQRKTIYSVYCGHLDGSFLQVIATRGREAVIASHKASANTIWIVRTIYSKEGERLQNWSFLDEQKNVISQRLEANPNYDPRERPWFTNAIENSDPHLSDVYVYNSFKTPGITASRRMANEHGVVGVDLTLTELSEFVSNQFVSENGTAWIYDDKNRIVAFPKGFKSIHHLGDLTRIDDPVVDVILGKTKAKVQDYFKSVEKLSKYGAQFNIAVAAPLDDFRQSFITMERRVLNASIFCIILFIPIVYVFSARLTRRVSQLAEDAKQIEHLEFKTKSRTPSHIIEFYELENTFDEMRNSLALKTQDLATSQEKLNRLVELGIAMSAERDTEKVMEMVLLGAKELANADGGTLYKIEDQALSFKILRNDTLNVAMGGTSGVKPSFNPVALFDEVGEKNHKNVVSHTVHASESVNIVDAYNNEDFDFSGTKTFDDMNGYRSQSFLTVPLKPRGGDVIGALQILNAQDEKGEIVAFSPEIQRFVEALAAQAATILYNRELLDAQEKLMDSMIHLIAGAIDAKSPYTGGHCERVPELATMLAREACESNDGVLADFQFKTEEEWREFSIGAWLHDCGKVITPEYVVDKASKLETIYNRIHEIRTRFEVLLRDAELVYYQGLLEGGEPKELKDTLEKRKAKLIDDYAFIAECNVGGEFMAEEKLARLKSIADETWVRNFDIKLGLSHQEESLYANLPDAPVEEKLLVDQPYHLIERERDIRQQYEALDFKTPVPEYLYNRGEIYNLSIARGTLTEEERFKITEHVMQTIAMLEKLPFPAHMKRIPEYAGTHHETMIGTGYPRGLSGDDLSIPARIMALADVFEALTASDRPYKKAKTLSEAVKILSFFKKDKHIDGEVFDLFLTSGVYREYAERFLLPDQIDEVDISQYLS